jgi:hypothetical protein
MASATSEMTDEQLQEHALGLLGRELGPGGLARFIRLNSSGRGDYTAERHTWQAGLTVDGILQAMDADSSTQRPR